MTDDEHVFAPGASLWGILPKRPGHLRPRRVLRAALPQSGTGGRGSPRLDETSQSPLDERLAPNGNGEPQVPHGSAASPLEAAWLTGLE